MKIFVKSRGNLRQQDYIYWLKCESPQTNSKLDNPNLAQWSDLIDTSHPGLLVLSQDNLYSLLISGLMSSRREPSSPGFIRNTILLTDIAQEDEHKLRVLTIYSLREWTQLSQMIDSVIQEDNHLESSCGYYLNCSELFDLVHNIMMSYSKNISLGSNKFKPQNFFYGGVGSNEWLSLADDLRFIQLPSPSKSHQCIHILVTKRLQFSHLSQPQNVYLLCGSESETNQKNKEFRGLKKNIQGFELNYISTIPLIIIALLLLKYLVWKEN